MWPFIIVSVSAAFFCWHTLSLSALLWLSGILFLIGLLLFFVTFDKPVTILDAGWWCIGMFLLSLWGWVGLVALIRHLGN